MGEGKAVHVNGLHANKTPSVDRVRVFFSQRPDTADLMKTCGRSPQRDRQVSDLAQGTVTCSFGTVNLRERRLTSLEGFPYFEGMHTLFLQDNFLSSFDHLGTQPGVKELTLDRNCIYDFSGAERLPKLRSLSLEQNPVADWDLFPVMACLAFNPQLLKVNGKVISKQQRQLVQQLDRPVTRIALRQGWILSASPQQEAEVDIPVEEFFFRLDSFVDQLLAQGVPAHLCEINVHHHLKRSYEMLADVRVSATPASPPCSAGPASLHSSRASLSRAALFEDTPGSASILSRPKWRPTGSRLAGEEAAEARERRRHEREAYNRWARHLDLLPPPAAPHQPAPEPAAPSAPAQSAPPPPLDAGADAGGRGAGRDEAAGLHGVIHPRSLEEPEEPEDEHYPDRPARRAAPGSPAEAAAPGVRGAAAGPELPWRLAGQRDPVRALAQQPPAWGAVPPSRPATAGAARASPPPGGGGHPTAPSPGQAVAARGARAQRSPEPEPDHGGRARPSLSPPAARAGGGGVRLDSSGPLLSSSRSPPPGALRFSPDWLDSVLDSGLGGAPGTVPGRAGGEVGVGSRLPDDEDIAAMLEDIKEAARSSGAREEWSPSPLPPEALREDAARAAHGPMQRLLLAAPDARPPPPAPPPHAAAPALAADSSAVRAARPPPAACGGARGPSTPPGPPPLAAKAPVPRRQAWPIDGRLNAPEPRRASPRAGAGAGAVAAAGKPTSPPPDPFGAAPVLGPRQASPVATRGRCRHSVYGRSLLRLAAVFLGDWHATCRARYRVRFGALQPRAALIARLATPPPDAPPARATVCDARWVDEAFRVWLFNAAWLLCRRGSVLRILRRRGRAVLLAWKVFVSQEQQRREDREGPVRLRLALMQRAVQRAGARAVSERDIGVGARSEAQEQALALFRAARRTCYDLRERPRPAVPRASRQTDPGLALRVAALRAWLGAVRAARDARLAARIDELTRRAERAEAGGPAALRMVLAGARRGPS